MTTSVDGWVKMLRNIFVGVTSGGPWYDDVYAYYLLSSPNQYLSRKEEGALGPPWLSGERMKIWLGQVDQCPP